MKTRSLTQLNLVLVLVLASLPLGGGATQSSATTAEPALTNVPPAAATAASASDRKVTFPTETAAAAAPSALRAEAVLPPNILPATPLAEVIKLAQSGVDESVMLSFITNSIKPFALDAEAIVYLNDLGVSGSVITTMMQHDQGLKLLPANAATPAAPEPGLESVAAAPAYVDPPPTAPAAEAQPTYVSNNYFYDSLAPYGNWVEVEGYGRCWQPTVVVANRSWQPYCDRGRWVYTDAGWYWLSDYSWGATTFHYGRWFSHPTRGWCWWPDTVWAPSWVNWRYSGAYCGWAPLPPTACYRAGFGFSYYGSSVGIGFGFGLGVSAYTFVPWGNFCGTHPHQYRVPPHYASQVYNSSTVVNNYGSGNNHTVINRGISPDRVREFSHTEVRTVNIHEQPANGARREQLARDGRTLVVHRPPLTSASGSGEARPARAPQPRLVGEAPDRGRSGSPGVGRPPGVSAPSATAPASAPKVNPPRSLPGSPQNSSRPAAAAPARSLIVIGGKSTAGSGGRDYSVRGTPPLAPAGSVPASSARIVIPPQSAPAPIVSSPKYAETAPAPVSRAQPERTVNPRGSSSNFSPPPPNAPGFTPRSAPVNSAPSYPPQPDSQISTPNGGRFESRPAPAWSTGAPGRSSARPDASPGPRNR